MGTAATENTKILERAIYAKRFVPRNKPATLYLVADAWDGRYIDDAVTQFLKFYARLDKLTLSTAGVKIEAGGAAHLIVYIGHNILMDYF